ncbi:MAG TPA: 1-deoxy-D-xylulose-5-phosphate synthase [Acidimicrobiales bacterium]|nr:1-deoxy-D-xylulose-5-phosphate synthase [Acidimicrobiales bacterium]
MSKEDKPSYPLLDTISSPDDLKALSLAECEVLAEEIRQFIVEAVTTGGTGHLGSNLGAVEITLAMHRVFSSPRDVLLFDTGHQAYVHKLITGRHAGFALLRREGGLSGYPSRAESEHDWIENSHASTALSYAFGIAKAFKMSGEDATRRVVALVGDGALTGGLAYEAMNNLGHAEARVCIILNDNGRSYAPTVSRLSESLTQLRLNPSFSALQARVTRALQDLPGVGTLAGQSIRSLTAAVRELVEPHVFFQALGIRYVGPIDGHDIAAVEQALKRAAAWQGPIVLHVLTTKGKGYGPAENDTVQCLHDYKLQPQIASSCIAADDGALVSGPRSPVENYTGAFSEAILDLAGRDERVVAITAAMPGPTGLLSFQARYPDRFIDVGIAEGHAMTAAAGMAMAGLRPVVAIYSTFLSRCFDQENLDVGLHRAPVVICADRAGITGDDGASHHGVLDMVLGLAVPGLVVFAPAAPTEIAPMLETALELDKPSLIRYPKTPGSGVPALAKLGMRSRVLREGGGDIVIVGIGKLAAASLEAAALLERDGFDVTVLDPRVVRPLDPALVERCRGARLVVTAEDGLIHGGAGQHLRGVLERAAEVISERPPVVLCLGVPTIYMGHADPDVILQRLELDASGIAASTRTACERLTRYAGNGSGLIAVDKRLGRRHRHFSFGGEGMVAR